MQLLGHLQGLQYKIIHRIIPCQKWLYNLKVIDSPVCQRCPSNCIDTITHHLVECGGLNNFWVDLESWWNRVAEYKVRLHTRHIIFGMYHDNHHFRTLNYVILLGKWFIRKQLYLDRPVNLNRYFVVLKQHLDTEQESHFRKMTQFHLDIGHWNFGLIVSIYVY